MARSLSQKSRAVVSRKLFILGIALLTTAPLQAQPEELPASGAAESVLPIEPDTLKGRFEASILMVKLARPELGRRYLAEILAMNPADEDLIGLRNDYGTSVFLSLSNVEGLNPEASQLLEKLNAAIRSKTNDPSYAASLLPKLSGTARERAEALIELRALGPYAVPTMLTAIENQTQSRDVLIYNLSRLGEDAVPPIIGALSSPSSKIRTAASEVLGWIGGTSEVIWLWHSAFAEGQPQGVQESARRAIAKIRYDDARHVQRVTSYGVPAQLLASAIEYLAEQHKWETRYEDLQLIPVWTWDADSATVVETRSTRRHAAIHFAERLAREAAELSPTNEDAPVVLLAARMSRDIEEEGWDQPLPVGPGTAHDLAVATGPDVCRQVLALALDHNLPAPALSAVTALGLNGSRSLLAGSNKKPEIIAALDMPHPRVQFAAAVSILEWEPKSPFKGARRVVEVLTRAVASGVKPETVIVDPNVDRGTMTASLFTELGYSSTIARTGIDGFQQAALNGDVELAVLHPNTVQWGLTQTIENLRADSRTRSLPLVIYGSGGVRDRFENITQRFQNVVFVNESVSSLEINRVLQPVLQQLSPPALTREQRTSQLQQAAFWLRWIATSSDPTIFDLTPHQEAIIQATSNTLVADDAIIALGAIGAPVVQTRFLEMIESPNLDSGLKKRSALQLAFHIQRFGLLLSPAELDRLVTVSNQQNQPDIATAISSVLGSLKPSHSAVRKMILDTPQSPVPIAATGTEME